MNPLPFDPEPCKVSVLCRSVEHLYEFPTKPRVSPFALKSSLVEGELWKNCFLWLWMVNECSDKTWRAIHLWQLSHRLARNNQGKKNNKVSLLGSRLTAAVGSDSSAKDVDYAHRPSMEQIRLSWECQALSPSAQTAGCWRVPAWCQDHLGFATGKNSCVPWEGGGLSITGCSYGEIWWAHFKDREAQSWLRCSWSSFPALRFFCAATAGRDKQRAGRKELSWFPAGRGKRTVVSALLSQTVFQSLLRACKVPTSVHKHAGAPLHSLLDPSDIHISSRQFPAFQSLQTGHIFHGERSHSGPAHHWGHEVTLPAVLGPGAGGEGKHLVSSWWLKVSHLLPVPPGPSSSSSKPAPSRVSFWWAERWWEAVHEVVLDEVLQILSLFLAAHVPTAPLAPSRGVTFRPLEEKLGQVLLQGAALSPWLRDSSGVQQMLWAVLQVPQVCDTARLCMKGGSAGVTLGWSLFPSAARGWPSPPLGSSCFFPPLLQNVWVSVVEKKPTKQNQNIC